MLSLQTFLIIMVHYITVNITLLPTVKVILNVTRIYQGFTVVAGMANYT